MNFNKILDLFYSFKKTYSIGFLPWFPSCNDDYVKETLKIFHIVYLGF